MSENGFHETKTPADRSAEKKAAVLGTGGRKSRRPVAAMAVCAALVLGGTAAFMASRGGTRSPAQAVSASGPSTEFVLPVSLFSDGKARFYRYDDGAGVTIQYFVLKSSDGVVRAAFDACDSCWPAGKGYRQEGDEMVCNNCRRRFPSTRINVVQGGCNPAPLKRSVRGDDIVITLGDILAGRAYFERDGSGG